MGRGGPPLPLLRQLHDGLPHLLLLHGQRHDRPGGHERGRPHPAVGVVLHAPIHLHDFRAGAKHDPRPLPPLAAAQGFDLVGAIRFSGCVGCGRCITWCPVGIDLTEEVRRLREQSVAHGARGPALRKGEVDHGPARS